MSSDSDDCNEFVMQWIIHFESFHYLKRVIKEFCAYCIQTSEFFTCYVKAPLGVFIDAQYPEIATYKEQTRQHGFVWTDGDMCIGDFYKLLFNRIPPMRSEVFTFSKNVKKYFDWGRSTHSFKYIKHLDCLPKNISISKNVSDCDKRHSKEHCAQKKVLQIASFLKCAYVPYLNLDVITDWNKQAKSLQKCEQEDIRKVKYAKHFLESPDYNTIAKINLIRDADRQYSTARYAARNLESECDPYEDQE